MGKPIAGRNKSPYDIEGIRVICAVLDDGTKLKNLTINKQRSINRFDLIDEDGNLHKHIQITATDKNGKLLLPESSSDELLDSLKNNCFCIQALDEQCQVLGFIIRLLSNKVTLGNGVVYNYQYINKECELIKVDVEQIILTVYDIEIPVGKILNVGYTVLPENATDKSVRWVVSDPSVIDVNPITGVVIGKRAGGATIDIISNSNPYVNETIYIGIFDLPVDHSLVLDTELLELYQYNYRVISSTIIPSTDELYVKWKSSDRDIASVDENGKVSTFSNVGEAIITATLSDGSDEQTCVVRVKSLIDHIPEVNVFEGTTYSFDIRDYVPEEYKYKVDMFYDSGTYGHRISYYSNYDKKFFCISPGKVTMQVRLMDDNYNNIAYGNFSFNILPGIVPEHSVLYKKINDTFNLKFKRIPDNINIKDALHTISGTSVIQDGDIFRTVSLGDSSVRTSVDGEHKYHATSNIKCVDGYFESSTLKIIDIDVDVTQTGSLITFIPEIDEGCPDKSISFTIDPKYNGKFTIIEYDMERGRYGIFLQDYKTLLNLTDIEIHASTVTGKATSTFKLSLHTGSPL